MPKLIYDVQFKIDQSSTTALKNLVDASTTGEVTKLTEKIEKLEAQLDKLKGTNQKVSKSTKQLVDESKRKTDAIKRDDGILKRALQTNNLHTKSVQEASARLQSNITALESHNNEMVEASLSTKRTATSQQALSKQVTTTTGTITRATSTLDQFNQQVNRSQKGFQGSNKEFAIANQTLFGFGDLAQDATQFSQGFAQGMRAIGNNIAFNAEMFGTLKTRTGSYMGAFKALGASFTGVGGAILAVNVAVMVATSLLTKFGNKAKDTVNELEEFIDATQELTRVSSADFLDINSLEAQKQGFIELKEVVEDVKEQEEFLLEQTKRYSSYVDSDAKEALILYREQNEGLTKIELDALEDKLEEVNKKLIMKNALLRLSPLAGFRLGLEQSTDILVNNFEAGLITSSSALEDQKELIEDYIKSLREGDVNVLEELGLDKDTPLAPTINKLLELVKLLSDTIPELKPVLTLEELGSDIDVFETRLKGLNIGDIVDGIFEPSTTDYGILPIFGDEDIIKEEAQNRTRLLEQVMESGLEARGKEANAAMEAAMEGSVFMAQKKLKELRETLSKETDLSRREELQAEVNQQQKIVNALIAGLGPVRTVLDDIIESFQPSRLLFDPLAIVDDLFPTDGFIDIPQLPILEEGEVLKSQAKELQDSLTQLTKDGAESRSREYKTEADNLALAEKAKQSARQSGVQIAQNVSSALQSLFGESKEIAIAEAIVSTYLSAQKAYQSAVVLSPFAGAAAAAAAITAGLARVAAIKSTDVGGGGGGGRSGGGGGGMSRGSSGLFSSSQMRQPTTTAPLFTPSARSGEAVNIKVVNTFDDRTVASVANNGNNDRRAGAVSGLGG